MYYLRLVFFLLLATEIAADLADFTSLVYFSKPLLCLTLIIILLRSEKRIRPLFYFVVAGLMLSLLGDVFLMIQPSTEDFFLLGLVSFLLAHICYSIGFIAQGRTMQQSIKIDQNAFLILGIAASAYYFMYPSLGELAFPVAFYILVIFFMWLTAGMVSKNPKTIGAARIGATFFIASDLLLALNLFVIEIPLDSLWVMSTYGIAQYLIVLSSIDKD